jgi:O-succinylbenzoate synthase
MKIEQVELFHVEIPLLSPFRTSFFEEINKVCILLRLRSDGLDGWGECVAMEGPWYSYESTGTAWMILKDYLVPGLMKQEIVSPCEVNQLMAAVRGHPMAKAGLENAVWTWFALSEGKPLSQLLGGVRSRVDVGVSVGIQPSMEQLVEVIDGYINSGYRRIKIKIEPGWDYEPLALIRQHYPDIRLMADANSAFTLNDIRLFQCMDDLDLLMIEQPLSYEDIADHARLQAVIRTPICLDESIHCVEDMQAAIDLKACRVLNMKEGRVAGLKNALTIHQMCQSVRMDMWCGGMLETGIGRAVNIHLASLPGFTLPGDISASDRYFKEDIVDPPFVLNSEDSTISVPTLPGLGVDVCLERIQKHTVRHEIFRG